MIGLDTNVLIRLLVRDDVRQLASAKRYIPATF
jgi:predicted nucleic-acid-binding protein